MKYTKELLQNTWGVVESKEHAEYVIELAELHGFGVWNSHKIDCVESVKMFFFCPVDNELQLYHNNISSSMIKGEKKTTIPLPPKDKEWPQVGDKACFNQSNGRLDVEVVRCKQPESGSNMSLVLDKNDHPFWVLTSSLSKPKTKGDLLTEELQTKLCNNNYVDNFTLASDIINGIIPGLSYNSDIESAVKGVINKHLGGDD